MPPQSHGGAGSLTRLGIEREPVTLVELSMAPGVGRNALVDGNRGTAATIAGSAAQPSQSTDALVEHETLDGDATLRVTGIGRQASPLLTPLLAISPNGRH